MGLITDFRKKETFDFMQNRRFTFRQLSKLCGTQDNLFLCEQTIKNLTIINRKTFSNGRKSDPLVSGFLQILSGDVLTIGADGNKDPDFWAYTTYRDNTQKIEMKSFLQEKPDQKVRVGPSCLFAKNSKVPDYRRFLKESERTIEEIDAWVSPLGYAKNDYYLLTGTGNWDGSLDTEVMFVSTKLLKKHIIWTGNNPGLSLEIKDLREDVDMITDEEIDDFLEKMEDNFPSWQAA